MHIRLLLVALLFTLAAPACHSTSSAEHADYVFAFLHSGPKSKEKTAEEHKTIQAGHMANIMRLAGEKKLVIAGPYGKEKHDATLRGIFVYDVATVDAARPLADTDPAIQAEVLSVDLHPFRASKDLRRTYELEHELDENAAKSGKKLELGDNIRGYVMIQARDAEKAERALAPLMGQGKILVAGRFGGDMEGQGLYVLDAIDVAAADVMLGAAKAAIGEASFDSWWSSGSVAKLTSAH